MKNKLTHEQLLEETKKCNILGGKLSEVGESLKAVQVYWGVSNGGDAVGMLNRLDSIIKNLQEIRNKPF